MRSAAALVIAASFACTPRAAKTTIAVGGISTGVGVAAIYGGHCCTAHMSAPDGRIVLYPVGGVLILAGTIAMISGLIALATAD